MNERIFELAMQAGEYVNSVYTPPVRSKTPGKIWEDGHIDWYTQFHQKFAELLIRECINIAYDYDKPRLSGPGLAIASNIESHFDIYIEEDGRFVK